jgi:hypothetical protein
MSEHDLLVESSGAKRWYGFAALPSHSTVSSPTSRPSARGAASRARCRASHAPRLFALRSRRIAAAAAGRAAARSSGAWRPRSSRSWRKCPTSRRYAPLRSIHGASCVSLGGTCIPTPERADDRPSQTDLLNVWKLFHVYHIETDEEGKKRTLREQLDYLEDKPSVRLSREQYESMIGLEQNRYRCAARHVSPPGFRPGAAAHDGARVHLRQGRARLPVQRCAARALHPASRRVVPASRPPDVS